MTVNELIRKLTEYPSDMEVMIPCPSAENESHYYLEDDSITEALAEPDGEGHEIIYQETPKVEDNEMQMTCLVIGYKSQDAREDVLRKGFFDLPPREAKKGSAELM